MLTLSTLKISGVKKEHVMRFIMAMMLTILSAWALSSYEVAQKADAAISGFKDSKSDMAMTLVNAKGQKRERKMYMMVFEREGGDKSLLEFLSPADVKGTKFLSYEHIDGDDDQWLYLPALKRVKRIASKNKSGSFMGSEFSYEDLGAFNIEKYTYSGDAKEVMLDNVTMYQSTRIPKDENSGYTKQIVWNDTKTFLVRKVEYYDRKKALLKTAIFEDYKKINGIWRVGTITMTNHQNDKQTILIWKNETLKNGLKESDFHQRVLKQ
jgi:outer membrane lipoprotein-sorting protein